MSIVSPTAVGLPRRLARAAAVVAITVGVAYTLILAGSFGSVAFRLGYLLIALVAIVSWLALALVDRTWLPSSRLMPAIAASLIAMGVSAISSSLPRLGLEMLGYAILLAEVYLLLVALMQRPWMRELVSRLAFAACAVLCTLYLVEVIVAWWAWWGIVGGPALPPLRPAYIGLTLASPNPLAVTVLLLAAFALGTTRRTSVSWRFAAMLLAILAAGTVVITASRGAWLGAAAALAVTGGAAVVSRPGWRGRTLGRLRSRSGRLVALVGALVFVAMLLVAAASGRLSLEGGSRDVFAAVSMRMFEAHPLTGTGPGTWPVLRTAYTLAGEPDTYVPHAHSVYLQTLAELGIVGAIAGIVAVASVVWLLVRALRSPDPARRRVALVAVFGVTLLAVHQTVDMFMNVPPVLFAAALPLAWVDGTSGPTEESIAGSPGLRILSPGLRIPDVVRERAIPVTMAVVTSVIGLGLLAIEAVTVRYLPAVAAADEADWAIAAATAGRAADADPGVTVYRFALGVAAANSGDMRGAGDALESSAAADDYPYAWLNLAAVRWRQGDDVGVRSALARAERLGLQRPAVAIAAGWLREQLGDEEAAVRDSVAALSSAPSLASDPFWTATPEMSSLWPRIWSGFQHQADARSRLVADLVAGRADLAREAAASLASDQSDPYGLVVEAWQGDSGAWDALQALARSRPLDSELVSWCLLIAGRRGDETAVARYRRWLEIDGASNLILPGFASVVVGEAQPVPALFFDTYDLLYRRPVSAAQVVDLLPQIRWSDHP